VISFSIVDFPFSLFHVRGNGNLTLTSETNTELMNAKIKGKKSFTDENIQLGLMYIKVVRI
jgi:hypothetical protein